ncbi:MAG: helix-turn-helix transcriptional regulator [Succinivibrionaceae bacterium]|nr:helix-turn-helix transcriptional regulator [Succinivibrionaceae bacterium]
MSETIGDKLQKVLKDKSISQKELATNIGITESAMSKYISGDRIPKMDILKKIAIFLDVSIDYLVGLEDADENNKTSFPVMKRILYRNAGDYSLEEKQQLLNVLLEEMKIR